MADPIKTPQQMAELVGQAQGQTTPPAVAPTPNPTVQPVTPAPVNVAQPTTGFLDLGNGKRVMRNSKKYQELIAEGYTDEKIVAEIQKRQQKQTLSGQSIQPTQPTPQTEPVSPVEKPIQEQIQPVQQDNLPDFQDNTQPRQEEIVNNLNRYYQSNPSMFQDRELFNKSFSYENRSDLQKSILDNWYKSNIDKVNEATALSRQLPGDVAKQYTDGKLQDTDLNALKLADPVKYTQVQEQIEKNRIMNKYQDLLYGEEKTTETPLDKITQQMTEMLNTKTTSNMYDEYQTALNSPDMTGLMDTMTSQEGEIKQIDEQINATKSELEAQFKGSGISQGRINALIQDQVQLLQNKRNGKALEYQTTADKYQNRLAVIKQNLEAKEKQFDMEQKQEQSTLNKLSFNYNIYADQQKRDDAKKASDLEFKRDIEKMNIQQEMAFNQAVKMDKLENGDINNADPYIVQKSVEKNVDQLMQQYDGLLTSTRDQLVTRIQDGLKTGNSYGQVQNEIMKDIQAKPEYSQRRNNKLGLDNKPVQIADGIYYQNGKMMSESQMRSMYNIPSKELEAIQANMQTQRAQSGASQYDNYDFVKQILNGELKTRDGVECLPGQKGGQCAAFVNDLMGVKGLFANTIDSKINITKSPDWNSPVPIVGGAVVIDNGSTYTDATTGKKVNAGHVGIVTAVNSDGTFSYIDSNGKGGYEKIANNNNVGVKGNMYFTRAKDKQSPMSGSTTTTKPLTDDQRVIFNSQLTSFRGNPVVKQFEDAMTQYSNIKSSLENPSGPGDISAIFTFMKSLDPTSVVRESEFNTAASSAGVAGKIGNSLKKLQNGEQLNDEQRQAFTALAKKFVENRALSYDRLYDDMERVVINNGVAQTYLPTRASSILKQEQPQQNTNIFNNLSSGVGYIAQPSYLQGLSILGY